MLVLVPTAYELNEFFRGSVSSALLTNGFDEIEWQGNKIGVGICGFGLAAAGSGAAYCIAEYSRSTGSSTFSVVLTGIAGTLKDETFPVGSAVVASEVTCFGIGRSFGSGHISAESLGWPQGVSRNGSVAWDTLALHVPHELRHFSCGPALSSVCSVGSENEAVMRKTACPDAAIEEMEGYAVALACRLWKCPLTMIRGISNQVGVLPGEGWKFEMAIAAARQCLSELLR